MINFSKNIFFMVSISLNLIFSCFCYSAINKDRVERYLQTNMYDRYAPDEKEMMKSCIDFVSEIKKDSACFKWHIIKEKAHDKSGFLKEVRTVKLRNQNIKGKKNIFFCKAVKYFFLHKENVPKHTKMMNWFCEILNISEGSVNLVLKEVPLEFPKEMAPYSNQNHTSSALPFHNEYFSYQEQPAYTHPQHFPPPPYTPPVPLAPSAPSAPSQWIHQPLTVHVTNEGQGASNQYPYKNTKKINFCDFGKIDIKANNGGSIKIEDANSDSSNEGVILVCSNGDMATNTFKNLSSDIKSLTLVLDARDESVVVLPKMSYEKEQQRMPEATVIWTTQGNIKGNVNHPCKLVTDKGDIDIKSSSGIGVSVRIKKEENLTVYNYTKFVSVDPPHHKTSAAMQCETSKKNMDEVKNSSITRKKDNKNPETNIANIMKSIDIPGMSITIGQVGNVEIGNSYTYTNKYNKNSHPKHVMNLPKRREDESKSVDQYYVPMVLDTNKRLPNNIQVETTTESGKIKICHTKSIIE
ncbi:hypothetical protein CI610_01686 [invertebrate metagenome]|uniref:Uncharacterized protein n=1 Tax=invertebrate metagenome TaxID=1711999 RepID=A0A2H9T7Z8_9ZZZZ